MLDFVLRLMLALNGFKISLFFSPLNWLPNCIQVFLHSGIECPNFMIQSIGDQ